MVMLVSLTLASCKASEPYLTSDYINTLVRDSGLGRGENVDESITDLIAFKVVDDEEYPEYLTYGYLALTLNNLIENGDTSVKALKKKGIIKRVKADDELLNEKDALEAIKKAVSLINNKEIERKEEVTYKEEYKKIRVYEKDGSHLKTSANLKSGELVYLEEDDCFVIVTGFHNDAYLTREATFDEIFESLEISDNSELDLTKAIVLEDDLDFEAYVNNDRELLAGGDTRRFTKDGFNVSYKITRSSIDARISKNIDGLNFFYDISVSNLKPAYIWKFKTDNIENAYLKLDYKTVEEIGVSVGRYKNCYLDLKDLDSSSFVNLAKSMIKDKSDETEATIKICELKVPIEGVPTLFFNVEVLAKFYTSGKAEIVVANKSSKGFENRNGKVRFINENNRDVNLKIGGSSSAAVGLNFNLEAAKACLMDIEADLGIKAKVGTTLHLYDEEGNHEKLNVDEAYSTYDDLAKENRDVKVCGDLSLNWMLKLRFNTPKTVLSRLGMSRDIELLDEKNQVFKNKSHIENFVFVDKCTRKDRLKTNKDDSGPINADKILLNKYSKVIKLGESYQIEIKGLPGKYSLNDLEYSSKDNSVVTVNNGVVYGTRKGASEVVISTKDHKYNASINVLVSED